MDTLEMGCGIAQVRISRVSHPGVSGFIQSEQVLQPASQFSFTGGGAQIITKYYFLFGLRDSFAGSEWMKSFYDQWLEREDACSCKDPKKPMTRDQGTSAGSTKR